MQKWRRGRPMSPYQAFPGLPCGLSANMWTLWKTQDSSVPSLWITPSGRLLLKAPSARISVAVRDLRMGLGTLKTPVQTVWHRSHVIEAPVPVPVVIHSLPGVAGASSSLIHRRRGGTLPERSAGTRYTLHLVFRLRRHCKRTVSFPHLWKGLWTNQGNRRSAAPRRGFATGARIHGYAPEQVFF